VVDYTDSNNNYGLLLLDPANGNQKNSITPTCTYNDYTSNIDTDTGLVFDQPNNALFLVYDSSYGCVQRLDLATGQISWSSSTQDNFNFEPEGFQGFITDSSLYFSNGSNLLVVNKSSGEMKVLLTNPDYDLLPLAANGQQLILRARRTRGTERFLLLGVDSNSGNLAWQVDMLGAAPIDPPNELSGLIDDTSTGWTWKLLPTGLVVLKFQAKPNQLVMETFNPANGTSQGQQTIALNRVSGDFYSIPKVIGWEGSVAYLSIESNIYALDGSTAKLKLVY
jgi:outer membrane protein assembly factor BamB